jgi:hypothetical protein
MPRSSAMKAFHRVLRSYPEALHEWTAPLKQACAAVPCSHMGQQRDKLNRSLGETSTTVVLTNLPPRSVISTDQREWRNPLMQSVMQMSVPRFASGNPCISRVLTLPKRYGAQTCQRSLSPDRKVVPASGKCTGKQSTIQGFLRSRWSVEMTRFRGACKYNCSTSSFQFRSR